MTNDAVLIDRNGPPTIRFERRLASAPERVWRAVTDEDEMRSWFPSAVQGERKVGAPLRFPFDSNVADAFEGEVTEWAPMSVFAFTWNGDQLRIELEADGDGTKLVFTHELDHLTAAARTASGWEACLAGLDAHLGGPAAAPDLWKTAYPHYLETMGPPLGAPADDGSMTWLRRHHVSVDDFDLGFGDVAQWGGDAESHEDLACERSATEHGTEYRITHRRAGTDAALAARWHALLVQLDMYLASKQLIPVDQGLFADGYKQLLS